MIRKLLYFALNQRYLTLGIVLAIIIAGVFSWISLKKEAYPDVGDTQVTIITKYSGRAAEEVEQQVTMPLERALNGVPNVISRRSKTIFGLSIIWLSFEDKVDDYSARQRVLEKIPEADLPEGAETELGPLTNPVGEILRYVIEADEKYSPMDIRTYQDWTVTPKLLQVKGIADVINFGGAVKQYHVITNPLLLNQYGLTLQDLIDDINKNNVNTGGNIIKRGEQGFVIRGIGAIKSKDDLLNIVISTRNGVPVFIRNVATVEEYPMPPTGVLGYKIIPQDKSKTEDNKNGVEGIVAMRRGENPTDVLEDVKQAIAEINENDLPPGMKLRIIYDRSELVNYTLETVTHTLFEGFSIVIIILVFFLGSVRSALVVATTIPISLLFGFMMMKITGIPANLLSLGAIDFGIIVDGAVVMVENIMRKYKEATPDEKSQGIIKLTLSAAQEVGKEIFFSISIIIMAYLPIFTFQRIEGKLFSPMAYTLSYAILGSMLLALTAIPILMSFIYKKYIDGRSKRPLEWHNPIFHWTETKYTIAVRFLTKYSLATVFISAIFVAGVLFIGGKFIGTEFLPALDEGAINIRCFFPVGIELKEANKYSQLIRETISKYKPVKLVVTSLGRNDDGTDPYGPNRMEILVGLNDYKTWTKTISKADLLKKIKADLENNIPGATFTFSQPILDNVTEAVTGSVADLAVLISGNDLDLMRKKADSVLGIIKTIRGATECGIEQEGNQAQLNIKVDRDAAARFGINISDVQKIIEAAIGGKAIGTLYEGSKKFDIVVRYSSEFKNSIDAIRNTPVISSTGARVPLANLATIKLEDGPTIVQREDGLRQISVRTNIQGRDQGGFVAEAMKKVNNAISLPRGYKMEWGGQFENLERAGKRLIVVIPLTVFIIFLILFSLYRNVKYVLIAMSAIPLALTGGILALLIRGYNFNVSAGVGFISLFGISIMSGVLYVSRTRLLIEDKNMPLREAVVHAAKIQLRPNLMAMLLALLGLIPATLATGIGSDVQRVLASVIVGGLTTAIFVTSFALPSIFYFFQKKKINA